MKNMARIRSQRGVRTARGFTLVEILVGLLVVAALAGGAIFVVTRVNEAATDTQKVENAKKMTDLLVAFWQAGGNMSAEGLGAGATSDAVISRLGSTTPLQIPSPVGGATPMSMTLPAPLPNSAAYAYAFDGVTGPHMTAVMGHPEVRP